MSNYFSFLISHWELSLLFIASLIWVILAEMNSKRSEEWRISAQDAIHLINKKSARIIDLRKEEAFMQGHIPGAKCVKFNPLSDNPKETLKISPQTNCLFVCTLGKTTEKAVQALRSKGYRHCFSLTGGMTAWEKENLPTVKGK